MSHYLVETDRLLLAPLVYGDAEEIHALWTHPEVRHYLWDDELIPFAQTAAILVQNSERFGTEGIGLWGARLHSFSRLVGFAGFWYFHQPPELQLIYGLHPSHWNQGLATKMARAIIQFGLETLHLPAVIGSTDAPNVASCRVMEKAGMQFDKRVKVAGKETLYYRTTRDTFPLSSAKPNTQGQPLPGE